MLFEGCTVFSWQALRAFWHCSLAARAMDRNPHMHSSGMHSAPPQKGLMQRLLSSYGMQCWDDVALAQTQHDPAAYPWHPHAPESCVLPLSSRALNSSDGKYAPPSSEILAQDESHLANVYSRMLVFAYFGAIWSRSAVVMMPVVCIFSRFMCVWQRCLTVLHALH